MSHATGVTRHESRDMSHLLAACALGGELCMLSCECRE
jgi:hypothetical protein